MPVEDASSKSCDQEISIKSDELRIITIVKG